MPTADPSNILFKIAHPDIYERNPFNVLNLSVFATARDIRRRREDIEAAFDAGTEAEEFARILPADDGRKPPSRAEVADLFAALEDPERRIAYALFWFWPEDGDAAASPTARRRNTDPNVAFRHADDIQRWEDCVLRTPKSESVVQRHNLAVFHHMMGLAYDEIYTEQSAQGAATPKEVDGHWAEAIRWWNDLAADSDLWHSVSELVSALGDPRLDYRFARSLRDQFAFAFDQINVELAIDYAKKGREADAKRQVEYMKQSQPDSDDVEGTFDDAFARLLRQTEAVVDAALAETKAKPRGGLRQVNAILAQTAEPISISRIVLDKGSPVRESIVTAIFSGVRSCLIAYGNETEDWDNCLVITGKLKAIIDSDEQETTLKNDVSMIASLAEKKSLVGKCWVCKNPIHQCERQQSVVLVPVYGELFASADRTTVSFNTRSIAVPICRACQQERQHDHAREITYSEIPEILAHPFVLSAVSDGWRIGRQMTKVAISDYLEQVRNEDWRKEQKR